MLIIYFSLTGRTKKVAEKIASGLNSPNTVIKGIKYLKNRKALVSEMAETKKGNLSNYEYDDSIMDLAPHDLVFFGTPVHGSCPAAVFHGYLENVKNIEGKDFIIFNTYRAISTKTFKIMEAEIRKKGGEVVYERAFRGLFRMKESKVKKFIDDLNEQFFND